MHAHAHESGGESDEVHVRWKIIFLHMCDREKAIERMPLSLSSLFFLFFLILFSLYKKSFLMILISKNSQKF